MMNVQSAALSLCSRISFLLAFIAVTIVTFGLTPFSAADDAGSETWTQELWTGVPGTSLNDLEGSLLFGGVADQVSDVESSIANDAKNYGSRVRGLITIPADGKYTFWLSASAEGELYVGTDGTKWSRKKVAASTTRGVKPGQLDAGREQQSEELDLQAGDVVFVEVLSKGASAGGHVEVAWSYQSNQVNWTQEEGVTASQAPNRWGNTNGTAARAIDGITLGLASEKSTAVTTAEGAWWEVDLGKERPVDSLVLWNLEGSSSQLSALKNFRVMAYDGADHEVWNGSFFEEEGYVGSALRIELSEVLGGLPMVKRVRVQKNVSVRAVLNLAEVEVLGPSSVEGSIYQARELVPSEVMVSYAGEIDDVDGDELQDDWELVHGFAADAVEEGDLNGAADPDRDGWSNGVESQMGTDPFSPDSIEGGVSLDRWERFAYSGVSSTVSDVRFYQEPDSSGLLGEYDTRGVLGQRYATRLRGYVEAPVSGEYRFWVAGREGVELYLSDVSGSKYHKQRIGYLTRDEGHGWGVGVTTLFRWDSYTTQQSEPVYLEAGERYYIEAIQQKGGHDSFGNLGVAWAPPGQDRKVIPGSVLYNYYVTEDDLDDDFLPDAWEVENGLDPEDNGAGDLARQGERGDFDGDGLTNRQEYLLGSAANAVDSDGDGLSDYDEVTFYGTNPGVSNDLTSTVVDTVDLAEHSASANWTDLDGGLIADNFRGEIAWDFTVPSDGWWVLELSARLRGDLRSEENFPLRFAVDDSELGLQTMQFRYAEPKSTKILTPYLTAGTHRLKLKLDNYVGRRTMQLLGLRVLQTGGLDANENGVADWLENEGAAGNQVATHASTSLVSPAFIEGSTRYSNQVAIAAGGNEVTALSALGPQHWYANVPLLANGTTPIEVSFEQGQVTESTGIAWTAWDAEAGEAPRLRAGDTLKLVLPSGGRVSFWARGVGVTEYEVAANEAITHTFAKAGLYKCNVRAASGNRQVNINVVTSSLETRPGAFVSGRIRDITMTKMARGTVLSSGPALEIISQRLRSPKSSWVDVRLRSRETGALPVAVRLYEGGPIVTAGHLNAVTYSDALQNDAQTFVGFTADGYRVLRFPIVIGNLPEGGYVQVGIHRNGVTFMDGTRTMTLYAEDFNYGVVYLDFRYPPNMSGGYCHYIKIFDGAGKQVVQ